MKNADLPPGTHTADGMEPALLGYITRFKQPPVAIYDAKRCIEILRTQGMSAEEAIEFFELNVESAWWGEGTPGFMHKRAPR